MFSTTQPRCATSLSHPLAPNAFQPFQIIPLQPGRYLLDLSIRPLSNPLLPYEMLVIPGKKRKEKEKLTTRNIVSNYGSKRNRNRLSRISSSRFLSLNPKINPITSSTVSPVNICTLCETLSSFLPSVKRKPVLPSILDYRRSKLVLSHRIIRSLNTLSS